MGPILCVGRSLETNSLCHDWTLPLQIAIRPSQIRTRFVATFVRNLPVPNPCKSRSKLSAQTGHMREQRAQAEHSRSFRLLLQAPLQGSAGERGYLKGLAGVLGSSNPYLAPPSLCMTSLLLHVHQSPCTSANTNSHQKGSQLPSVVLCSISAGITAEQPPISAFKI